MKLLNETLLLVEGGKSGMLTLRRNEKDFLARLDIKYQGKFKDNYGNLMNYGKKFNENIDRLELGGDEGRRLGVIVNNLQIYNASFNKIIALHQKIGLDHESGLRGKLRKAVHDAEDLLKEVKLNQLTVDMLMLRRNEKDFMLRKLVKYLDKHDRNYAVFSQHLHQSTLSNAAKAEIGSAMATYRSMFKELGDNYKQLGLTPKEGLQGEMRSSVHVTEENFDALNEGLSRAVQLESSLLYKELLIITTILLALVAGIVLSIAHSINARLGFLQEYLNKQASNPDDLSELIQIKGKDEIANIARIFNEFIGNFKVTFSQIPEYSDRLEQESNTGEKVTELTHQLALSQQVESGEITEAMQQMLTANEEVAKNIQVAASSAEETDEAVLKGKQFIQDVSLSINSLASKLQASTKVTKELEENSNNISTVLDVIRSIADQTNLLALNAAIEAARAGEHGRGFAVVADEVRTLAGRTQDSTAQIQGLIEKLQKNVKNTVDVMEEGSIGASSTAENASSATHVLNEISQSVGQISELNTRIKTASEAQGILSNDVSQRISSINEMANKTAEESTKARESSVEIKGISSDLKTLVSTYKF